MAKNISSKKPLSIKLSSHANNKTNSKQKPNLQTYTINGVKVRLTSRESRVFKKAAKEDIQFLDIFLWVKFK